MALGIRNPFFRKTSRLDEMLSTINDLQAEIGQLRAAGLNTPGNENVFKYLWPDDYDGNNISKIQALNLSAVYAAINILVNSLNVPISIYRRTSTSREVVTPKFSYEYQCHKLLHFSPNRMLTPSEWIAAMESTRWLNGNSYSVIIRNSAGFPTAFRYVNPDQVSVRYDNVQLYYDVYSEDGRELIYSNLRSTDMIHMKALSLDGRMGKSPIDLAAQSLKFGIETQKAGNKFFESGMRSAVVLSHPGVLGGVSAEKNLRDSFDQKLRDNKTIVLEEGLKPFVLTVTPEQAEFLSSREFSVTEVARWFNIPETMLANNDPTYSNIEQFGLMFTTHNVRPRARQWEQELNWKLLGNDGQFYTEFNLNSLLRADIKTRFEVYSLARQNGIMSANECRELENMNPREGGDNYDNPNITPGNGTDTETE